MAQLVANHASILKALSDSPTCPSEILLQIKTVFLPPNSRSNVCPDKENGKTGPRHARTKSAVPAAVVGKSAARAKAHSRQLTVVEVKAIPGNDPKETLQFAFQVLNSCIQKLSAAAKSHQLEKKDGRGGEHTGALEKTTDDVLQAKATNIRQLKSSTSCIKTQVTNVAICACSALSYLRSHYSVKERKDSTFQVENGSFAVIGKCLELDLWNVALDQLWSLKNRLNEHLKMKSMVKTDKRHGPLLDLLTFQPYDCAVDDGVKVLMARVQQYVFQLVVIQHDKETIETIAQSCASIGETKLLSPSIESARIAGVKGSRALATVHRSLVQLATLPGVSAHAILLLKCAAISLQTTLFGIGEKPTKPDFNVLVDKLCRYLDAYTSSSQGCNQSFYLQIQSSITRLLDQFQRDQEASLDLEKIHKSMYRVAIIADLVDEAHRWAPTSKVVDSVSANPHDAVKIATARLASKQGETLLRQAVRALNSQTLADVSTDYDRLLIDVVAMRRAIHRAVSEKSVHGKTCLQAATACLQYLGRFMGPRSASTKPGPSARKLEIGSKFIRTFISTVIVCCMGAVETDKEVIEALELCCRTFSLAAEWDPSIAEERFDEQRRVESSIFLVISKLCYRLWNLSNAVHGLDNELGIRALRLSVDCIRPWTVEEQDLGQYPQKLTQLTEAYIASRYWGEANVTFGTFLEYATRVGALEKAAKLASRSSSSELRASCAVLFHRPLRCLLRVTLKLDIDNEILVHDNLDLEPEAQGILLEWQLEQFSHYALREANINRACFSQLKATVTKLLQLYGRAEFPVRRLRVALSAARLLNVDPGLFDLETLLEEYNVELTSAAWGHDAELRGFYSCTLHLLRSLKAIEDVHADGALTTLECVLDALELAAKAIRTQEDIGSIIDDMDILYSQLVAMADAFALVRNTRQEARALVTILRITTRLPAQHIRSADTISRLASVTVQLGHFERAAELLQAARQLMNKEQLPVRSRLSLLAAEAEYAMSMEKLDEARDILQTASQMAEEGGHDSFVERTFTSKSANLNLDDRKVVARFTRISADLAVRRGELAFALRLSLMAKAMLYKVWSSTEQFMRRDESLAWDIMDNCPSSDDMSNIETTAPVIVTRSYSHLASPQLQALVPELLAVAMVEIKTHESRGAYHEIFDCLKNLNKIANYVGGGIASICDTLAADVYARSLPMNNYAAREAKLKDANDRLRMVEVQQLSRTGNLDDINFLRVKANVLSLEQDSEQEMEALESSLSFLKSFMDGMQESTYSDIFNPTEHAADELAEGMASLQIEKLPRGIKTTKAKPGTAKVQRTTKGPSKTKAKASDQAPANIKSIASSKFMDLHATILQDIVRAIIAGAAETDEAAVNAMIEKAETFGFTLVTQVTQAIVTARWLMAQVQRQMDAEISFNALQDSIIALPLATMSHQRDHVGPEVPTKTPRKTKTTAKTKAPATKKASSSAPSFTSLLRKAIQLLDGSMAGLTGDVPIRLTQEICQLKTSAMLLLNASDQTGAAVSPLEYMHALESTDIFVNRLNRQTHDPTTERLTPTDLRRWPSLAFEDSHSSTSSLSTFAIQDDFVDILPSNWNVVSISLGDEGRELRLSRYRHGQPPIVLRVPFTHRESEDEDEDVLDMQLAYERLGQIIKQHEFSPQDPGVINKSEFKKQWWENKHELDFEMKQLLNEVEDRWLAGVKGLFSTHMVDATAMQVFQIEIESILQQHCPAKKARGKGKAVVQTIQLQDHILELFIGLGDPRAEVEVDGEDGMEIEMLANTASLCDGIQDLVRLILETLQFGGESIAIDEVDLDAVTVKVIDALRDYYSSLSEMQTSFQHTVLILENQLHGFPWESLPCLRNQSTSRLPSLADLRDRILAARLASREAQYQGATAIRSSGASLLNPSGDLQKTAQRFEPWLTKVPPNWAHLRQAPDDQGWTSMLSENSIFLYVGHGSTSQYVRPRVVRRLGYAEPQSSTNQTCATSWLIGCGSVAVEDLGTFQPSGMILSYLEAGSPAVLGALWDVGDIDADQFTLAAGDYWGLWDENNRGLDAKTLAARKKVLAEKKEATGDGGRKMSMCEAAMRARARCKLPYLNGAAFVVYGIPVFLDG